MATAPGAGAKAGRRPPFANWLRRSEGSTSPEGLAAAPDADAWAAPAGPKATSDQYDAGVSGDMIWNESIAERLGYGKK